MSPRHEAAMPLPEEQAPQSGMRVRKGASAQESAMDSGTRKRNTSPRDPNPTIASKWTVTPPLSEAAEARRNEERARQIDDAFGIPEEEREGAHGTGALPPMPQTAEWKSRPPFKPPEAGADAAAPRTEKKKKREEPIVLDLAEDGEREVVAPHDPSERFRPDIFDAIKPEPSVQQEEQRIAELVDADPEVKRWRSRLSTVPMFADNMPARHELQSKIRKAELLTEQRDVDAKEKTAKQEAETTAVAIVKQEKKIAELEARKAEQEAAVIELRKNVEAKEQERANIIAKKQEMVGSKAEKRRSKGEDAIRAIEETAQKQADRLKGIEAMIASATSDEVRSEATLRRDALLKEMADTDRNRDQIVQNVHKNDAPPEASPFDALLARADKNVEHATDALSWGESALDDVDADLTAARAEHHRLLTKHREASSRADALVLRGVELAVALSALSAVMMEDDVHVPIDDDGIEMKVPVIEAAPVPEPAATPEFVPLDEEIVPEKNSLAKNMGALAARGGLWTALGLGSAVATSARFGETFFGNAKKLLDDPGKFFAGVGSRFKKEIDEHGGILGTLKGIKWVMFGDPDKKKE